MAVIGKNIISFLKDLKNNNNREWFNENKDRFKESSKEFEDFTDNLILKLSRMDKRLDHLRASDCIFRIYKDVRFSRDKSPYKTNFGAYIRPGGRKAQSAGYYIHIEPDGESMIGAGIYRPESKELAVLRAHIAENGKKLQKILNQNEFKKLYSDLWSDSLKKVPRGYDAEHPMAEYLKYKSIIVSRKFSDRDVISTKFFENILDNYKIAKPFNDFINSAFDGN